MLILGLSCYHHDSSACVLADGQLVAYVEEERLNREKHSSAFPRLAIAECLRQAGITARELDHAGFFWVPWKGIRRRLAQPDLWLPRSMEVPSRYGRLPRMLAVPRLLRREFGFRGRFHFVDHYAAHAAVSFLLSPFDRAAVLILDGNGEIHTSWAGLGKGSDLREYHRQALPHSLGRIYGFTTEHLGFLENCDEGKVMAMAAFGDVARFGDDFRSLIQLLPGGRFGVTPEYFDQHVEHKKPTTARFESTFGPRRRPDEPLAQEHFDLAAALQAVTEEAVLHVARDLADRTGARALCLGGGVALNCSANGRVASDGPFEELFVPPPAGDAGTALGAALHVYHDRVGGERIAPLGHAGFGPAYGPDACRGAALRREMPFRISADPAADAARMVTDGKIVGWFQGRMEMGPRALGARSIVADPRDPAAPERINDKVKHREPFRPFAPSVLAEHCSEYFEFEGSSPFMLLAVQTRGAVRDRIPAVCHEDGSARIQTVGQELPPWRRLIERFDAITGVPMVLNTSFNRNGEPIVCTPDDALECFAASGLDALVLEDLVLERDGSGNLISA